MRRFLSWEPSEYLPVVLTMASVIVIYIWYVTVGYWTTWPKTTYAYDLLASAFQNGQVALLDKPDPALLALPDPFDPASRDHIQFLWDASLYNSTYYLYFGPVPALLLVVVKLIVPRQIPDQYLVFSFTSGLYVFICLLIVSFWHRFFRQLPIWALLTAVLMGGLVSPTIWLLSRPAVYEAAIASCQFFFIGGFYFAYSALSRQNKPTWMLILAGIFWACSIGSRTTVIVPVGFMLLMAAGWLLLAQPTLQTTFQSRWKLAALVVPILIGLLALGWYNWDRFGSILEFGLRYQLTWINLHIYQDKAFSAAYFFQNLRGYLVKPPGIIRTFPFFKPRLVLNSAAAQLMPTVDYHPEAVTGLLFSAPFLLMALIPLASLFSRDTWVIFKSHFSDSKTGSTLLTWVSLSLLGSALLSFVVLLIFFYVTMRYLEDVVPSLLLVSTIGFWCGYRYVINKPWLRTLYALVSIGLAGYSAIASLLLSITGYEERFRHLNHALLNQLVNIFGH